MRLLNFGSINIDYVYRVPHIVRPGETLASTGMQVFAGGKGANQSVALAKAGAPTYHAGRIGADGEWLLEKLGGYGVDTSHIEIDPANRTGNAIIQVDDGGENAIVLFPGANCAIPREQVDATLDRFGERDWLLLQNEINDIPYLITAARARGMSVAFNPAPMTPAVRDYPLDQVNLLVVNETEARDLTGLRRAEDDPVDALRRITAGREFIITWGERGATFVRGDLQEHVPAAKVQAVDTTAAGDTFIGYFLAARAEGQPVRACLELACAAAGICVTRHGAMDAIPLRSEVTVG